MQVFAGDTVVGVVSEHPLPEAENLLAMVTLTVIDRLGESEATS